jgi:hypothetical protein
VRWTRWLGVTHTSHTKPDRNRCRGDGGSHGNRRPDRYPNGSRLRDAKGNFRPDGDRCANRIPSRNTVSNPEANRRSDGNRDPHGKVGRYTVGNAAANRRSDGNPEADVCTGTNRNAVCNPETNGYSKRESSAERNTNGTRSVAEVTPVHGTCSASR